MNSTMKARILFDYEIADYELFLERMDLSCLTQSSIWAEFQRDIRGNAWRLVVEEDGEIFACCLIVRHRLPGGYAWFYSQGGPIGDYESPRFDEWFMALKSAVFDLARKEGAVFWRISPLLQSENKIHLQGFKKAHSHYQPESTLVIDLTQSEEEILAAMKQKGRYNIKMAGKSGVKVRFSDGGDGDLERFYKLLQKTTSRNGFHAHDFEYYLKMMKMLGSGGNAKLAMAEEGGDVLAGAIMTFYRQTATYYYGASGEIKRNFMAPYLLQWEMIKLAKEKGYAIYDFLGISPEGAAAAHPWRTVTDFKLKFGGRRLNYLPEQEIVYRPLLFSALRFVKLLRRWYN